MGMFDFFSMMDNYEDRKVARYDADWGFISTAFVTDADLDYETAVRHRDYNDGQLVIVEAYATREEAQAGHERWVATMSANELPESLRDNGRAGIAQLCDAFSGDEDWREFKRTPAE
jgi:hypothetical protein